MPPFLFPAGGAGIPRGKFDEGRPATGPAALQEVTDGW
jgi:hypothetical protein